MRYFQGKIFLKTIKFYCNSKFKLKQLFQTKYNSVSNQVKRELYRGTKGLWRPWYMTDGSISTYERGDTGRTSVQYDLDSDNNGTQDHLETIDFNDIDLSLIHI